MSSNQPNKSRNGQPQDHDTTTENSEEEGEEEKGDPENINTNPPSPPNPSTTFITENVGVVKFTNRSDEIAYMMLHKIEKYNSLSNLEKEHTKSVYFRNEEDKRRGVEYVMNKILGLYKECLEPGPEYLTGLEDEEEVM
ncbi:hypothetical protein Tco_1258605 [Tanacetum coccineum]